MTGVSGSGREENVHLSGYWREGDCQSAHAAHRPFFGALVLLPRGEGVTRMTGGAPSWPHGWLEIQGCSDLLPTAEAEPHTPLPPQQGLKASIAENY